MIVGVWGLDLWAGNCKTRITNRGWNDKQEGSPMQNTRIRRKMIGGGETPKVAVGSPFFLEFIQSSSFSGEATPRGISGCLPCRLLVFKFDS